MGAKTLSLQTDWLRMDHDTRQDLHGYVEIQPRRKMGMKRFEFVLQPAAQGGKEAASQKSAESSAKAPAPAKAEAAKAAQPQKAAATEKPPVAPGKAKGGEDDAAAVSSRTF